MTTKEIICNQCNGSGEGQYDGTTCHYCKGRGTQLIQLGDSEDYEEEETQDDSED